MSGKNYVGGITGYGSDISNCYSLSTSIEGSGYIGGITGDNSSASIISKNYFVNNNNQVLGGIKNISYKDIAENISYDTLVEIENLPRNFTEFKTKFYDENDELIHTITSKYGASIDISELPEIIPSDGNYGKWNEFEDSFIQSDQEVYIEYLPYLTTISTQSRQDDLDKVLFDGNFTDEIILTLTQTTPENHTVLEGQSLVEEFTVDFTAGDFSFDKIRYYTPDDNIDLYMEIDGNWQKLNTIREGKYLVSDSFDNFESLNFRVIQFDNDNNSLLIIACTVFSVIILINITKRKKI